MKRYLEESQGPSKKYVDALLDDSDIPDAIPG